ncbi:Integrator complex subunit 9 [Entomortierella beljakovae]|nr:Integrator complex subunit 9 [Entomortierella beljakovae]
MRLTSLLPDGEPNCMLLKLRQMLILLDCGLGQEQLYNMPVREGGLTEEAKEAAKLPQVAGSTVSNDTLKRKEVSSDSTDIRQDWASFLKASTTHFPQKKARGPNSGAHGTGSSASNTTEATSSSTALPGDIKLPQLSRDATTKEYMFKLPDFSGVDLKSIDVVLISNYNHILALPYLTEFTEFQGRIFATEPTIEFGRQLMTEFVSFFGTSVTSSPHEFIDRKKLIAQSGSGYYPAYTNADIKACIDKIQPVRFREHIALYGSLKLTAHSAGYCLGSSNWLIQIGTESVSKPKVTF